MKVLIGCEESGVVRDAFTRRGHDATSLDIIESRSPNGKHVVMDIMEYLQLSELSQDKHGGTEWDLIILHPPCTYLAVSGNRWYGRGQGHHDKRIESQAWTKELWELAKRVSHSVALENPVGVLNEVIGKPTQYIQPWEFGHGETKKTGLWLHNLPMLKPTDIVEGREQRIWQMAPSPTRARDRSETYRGIAEAMVTQWGCPQQLDLFEEVA